MSEAQKHVETEYHELTLLSITLSIMLQLQPDFDNSKSMKDSSPQGWDCSRLGGLTGFLSFSRFFES